MMMMMNLRYNETTGREGFVVHNKQLPCDDEFAFMVKVLGQHQQSSSLPDYHHNQYDHHHCQSLQHHDDHHHQTVHHHHRDQVAGVWGNRGVLQHQLESSVMRQHHPGDLGFGFRIYS